MTGITNTRVPGLEGLSPAEVQQRIDRGDVNDIPQGTSRTVGDIVRANVFTRFNLLLGVLVVVVLFVAPIQDACLDFIDTLWTGQGFCGSWADDVVDVEYTYYALLSLGHLSL